MRGSFTDKAVPAELIYRPREVSAPGLGVIGPVVGGRLECVPRALRDGGFTLRERVAIRELHAVKVDTSLCVLLDLLEDEAPLSQGAARQAVLSLDHGAGHPILGSSHPRQFSMS